MTADRYLKEKQQRYKENYPNYNYLPYSERVLQERKRQQLARKKQNSRKEYKTVPSAKRTVNMQKQFKAINKHVDYFHKSSSGLSLNIENILSLTLLTAAAIFSISKYVDIKESSYSPEYSPSGSTVGDYSGDNTGHLSAEGKAQLKQDEGCVLYAYDDKDGYWPHKKTVPGQKIKGTLTIGYGHTGSDVNAGMEITQAEAEALLDKDIIEHENRVKKQLKDKGIETKISQKQFDAMVNYAFNYGRLGDKFLTKLKAGDYLGASTELEVGGANKARMDRLQKAFREDVTADNKLKAEPISVGKTSAGKIHRYANGTQIEGYKLDNPAKYNTGKDKREYIDLSQRAEAYLRDVGGKGIVTSGAEGNHAGGTVSHKSGNKVDVVAYGTSDEDWANCAIPFIKNKNTAFVNFEDFDETSFKRIKQIIYSKLSQELINKCEKSQTWLNSKKAHPFLTRSYTGGGLHLDIGILPNAYSEKAYKEEEKANQQKLNEQQKKLEEQEKQKQAEEKKKKEQKANVLSNKTNPVSNNIFGLFSDNNKSVEPLTDISMDSPENRIKKANIDYKNARK